MLPLASVLSKVNYASLCQFCCYIELSGNIRHNKAVLATKSGFDAATKIFCCSRYFLCSGCSANFLLIVYQSTSQFCVKCRALLPQVQANKAELSYLRTRVAASGGINGHRPAYPALRLNAKWSNDELLLAVQGRCWAEMQLDTQFAAPACIHETYSLVSILLVISNSPIINFCC